MCSILFIFFLYLYNVFYVLFPAGQYNCPDWFFKLIYIDMIHCSFIERNH